MVAPHTTCRALVTAALALAGASAAGPALAHSDVATTAPRDGAVLAAPPRQVTVTYAAPLGQVTEARVLAGGRDVAAAPRIARADARRAVIPLRAGVVATGAYAVSWTVVGADGHALSGRLAFRVRPADARVILGRLGAIITAAAAAVGGAAPPR